jgi:hypothetical protein
MTDDSMLQIGSAIVALIMGLVVLLYWDHIRAWIAHRNEIEKQRRNRQGRA